MKHYFIFLVLFIVIGCSSSLSPVDDGLQKQIFHFGNGSEPQGIDPHIVTGVPEHHILISLCEGLTIPSPYGDENLPGAAESWTVSDDGKRYIFKLRKSTPPWNTFFHRYWTESSQNPTKIKQKTMKNDF